MKRPIQFGGLLLALILATPLLAQQRGTAPPASLLTGGTQMAPASPSILTLHSGDRGTHSDSRGHFPGHGGAPLLGTVPRHEQHHQRERFVAPLYSGYYPYYGYGYSSPVYVEDNTSLPGAGTFDNGQGTVDSEGPDAPTVFENRRQNENYYRPRAGANSVLDESRYGEHYTDGREARVPSQPQQPVTANGNENR